MLVFIKKLRNAVLRLARVIYGQLIESVYSLWKPDLVNTFAIVSHLTFQERIRLYRLSRGKGNIVEIGSYIGASACCFGYALKEQGAGKVICIDTWNNDAMSEGNRDTWAEFQANTKDYQQYISPVRGFSTEVIEKVREITSQLDILFIDGDHSYEGAKADWDAYKSFLKPGSLVIFHDYGWAEGVKKVVHEEVMPLATGYGQLPNMWWGTLSKSP